MSMAKERAAFSCRSWKALGLTNAHTRSTWVWSWIGRIAFAPRRYSNRIHAEGGRCVRTAAIVASCTCRRTRPHAGDDLPRRAAHRRCHAHFRRNIRDPRDDPHEHLLFHRDVLGRRRRDGRLCRRRCTAVIVHHLLVAPIHRHARDMFGNKLFPVADHSPSRDHMLAC